MNTATVYYYKEPSIAFIEIKDENKRITIENKDGALKARLRSDNDNYELETGGHSISAGNYELTVGNIAADANNNASCTILF